VITRGNKMRELYRAYLNLALTLLILTLIALPFLKPGSPSFIVNIIAMILLIVFILSLIVVIRKTLGAKLA